jgi:predicted nucleotidyltransferase
LNYKFIFTYRYLPCNELDKFFTLVKILKMNKHKIKILNELKSNLKDKLNDNLKDIILFGSQLSYNVGIGSDYDILILTKKNDRFYKHG